MKMMQLNNTDKTIIRPGGIIRIDYFPSSLCISITFKQGIVASDTMEFFYSNEEDAVKDLQAITDKANLE